LRAARQRAAVDDEIGAFARHRGDDILTPGDVDTVAIVGGDIVARRPGEAAQLAPHLAAGAKRQKLHRALPIWYS
jgi:hypothetical protein